MSLRRAQGSAAEVCAKQGPRTRRRALLLRALLSGWLWFCSLRRLEWMGQEQRGLTLQRKERRTYCQDLTGIV